MDAKLEFGETFETWRLSLVCTLFPIGESRSRIIYKYEHIVYWPMAPHTKESRKIQAVLTMFDIVECLREGDGATLAEVSEATSLAKSTVHAHLTTLLRRGYVVKEGSTYHIGLQFLDHGMYAKRHKPVTRVVNSALDQLAQDTGEAAWLVVEEHGRGVALENAVGDRAVKPYGRVGRKHPLHSIASGKALLANLPEARREQILDEHPLVARTDHTIVDRNDLLRELDDIRETGVAFEDEEAVIGVRGVAVPIVADEQLHGAVSIVGPAKRIRGERFRETLPDLIMGTTNEIELRLTY